jgi:HPt (histidine-containing phosphotransfer) domain-containing protein
MIIDQENPILKTSTPELIRTRMLTELRASLGGIADRLLPELCAMLLEDASKMFAELNEAIQTENLVKIKEVAHTLKGSCITLGIIVLAEHFQELEYLAKTTQLDLAAFKLKEAEAEYFQVQKVLKTFVDWDV